MSELLTRERLENAAECTKLACKDCACMPDCDYGSCNGIERIAKTALAYMNRLKETEDALEEATETIENIYGHDTKQTERYRDIINDAVNYHNPADVKVLKQAGEVLHKLCMDDYPGFGAICRAAEAIDKVVKG